MRTTIKVIFLALVVMGLATAVSADQAINWVSVTGDGSANGANGANGQSAVSDNGRFVAFRSASDNLVAGDSANNDVFVKDMETGEIEMASVSSSGVKGNANSGNAGLGISADGRYVVFTSDADNLVAGDSNGAADVFIRDRQAGTTSRALSTSGAQGLGAAIDPAISGNGRFVAFAGAGYEPGLAANKWGLYVYDRVSGTSERITDGVDIVSTSSTYNDPSLSDDGRYVAFLTGQLGQFNDIVLFDRQTDTYEVANPRIGGERPQSTHPTDLDLSGNGNFVTFSSSDNNLVAGDSGDSNDVFVYDASTNKLERIVGGGATVSEHPMPVISGDGRFVAFTSFLDYYDETPNSRSDIVLYDRQSDTGEVVSVYDDGSPSTSNSGSTLYQPAISRDGRFVVFLTGAGFDAGDTGSNDLYIVDREGLQNPPPGGDCQHDFTDVDSTNIFEEDICWLANQGITRGCNPPANTEFCPKDRVTRGQMAAFLVRALGYTDNGGGDLFDDDNTSVFEGDIDRLGTAGVTRGCNPPTNSLFCPTENVTRGQMAAFLVRALGYTDNGGGDLFDDDNGSVFEADIDRLGTAGVTRGCNPPANDLFCPAQDVTREQMAAFLRRALGG